MVRFLAATALVFVVYSPNSFSQQPNSAVQPATTTQAGGTASLLLPPPPSGKATVIGGSIRKVDPVQDEMTLKVFGGHSMKILFDARTRFYRNGVRTPLRDLHSGEHASVETVLDGTQIFARSIHILSRAPDGQCQGQVVSYDPVSRELSVSPALSREPITIRVPAGTPIVRGGQNASASAGSNGLESGSLVSVMFTSASDGRGIAKKIEILAAPGSSFVFTGNITFLDMHAHEMAVTDAKDGNSYKISFDPSQFPVSLQLHEGDRVKVTAMFDGHRYVANAISIL